MVLLRVCVPAPQVTEQGEKLVKVDHAQLTANEKKLKHYIFCILMWPIMKRFADNVDFRRNYLNIETCSVNKNILKIKLLRNQVQQSQAKPQFYNFYNVL